MRELKSREYNIESLFHLTFKVTERHFASFHTLTYNINCTTLIKFLQDSMKNVLRPLLYH